ncbi:MAG: hypothetical protein ABIH66_04115 [bacterium]
MACFVFSAPVTAADCDFSLSTSDPTNTGLADAAHIRIVEVLEANGLTEAGCAETENAPLKLTFTIGEVDANRRFNAVGLLLAGGYSSITKLDVTAAVSLEATKDGEEVFSDTIAFRNSPHELFSGWRKARGVKKRAVEDAADHLAARLLKQIKGDSPTLPARSNGDLLNEDRDIWPIFGAALADIAIHESGHFINARFTGHKANMQGNDTRTFEVGPHTVLGISALFTHHVGDDQLFMMPDVLYDFSGAQTPRGLEYRDENGAPVSHGRRDHALIAYSGILFQNLANEVILTHHPRLIDEDRPFLKGMVFFNLFIPAFYTFEGRSDYNSDLRMLQRDLGYDKWQVNAIVLVPRRAGRLPLLPPGEETPPYLRADSQNHPGSYLFVAVKDQKAEKMKDFTRR